MAKQVIVGGPHRQCGHYEQAVDMAESDDSVNDDGEKTDRRAERDLGSRTEAEEQHEKRQEQDDGNGIDRGEQRLEKLDPIARTADQIGQSEAAPGRKRGRRCKVYKAWI